MGRFLSNKNIFGLNKHKNIYHNKISMDTDEIETITQLREEIHNLQET